jgi:ubiquinone/menaquinone biosynthesis C-methylase UbiE
MTIREAYNEWAIQYDTNTNRTRDLEARALRELLAPLPFESCLEMGCGTGKNTVWLASRCEGVTAVDFSEKMLALARQKTKTAGVIFVQADLLDAWNFTQSHFDLVTFSLVLEHVADLQPVFEKAVQRLQPGGHLYIGELHPFKQYGGTKARYETDHGTVALTCFVHHLSDFIQAGLAVGLRLVACREYFDEEAGKPPRILALVFQKEGGPQ